MKEEIIGFINDIKDLDLKQQAKRIEDFVIMQVENFILWNWSDEKERKRELKSMEEWIKEDDR